MNQILKLTLGIGLICSLIAAKPTALKLDFNGSWNLDTAKSDFGGLPKEKASAVVINILQNRTGVTFDRTFQNVPVSSKETLGLDGKELEIKQDDFTAVRTLSLSADKMLLTVSSKYHVTREGQDPWDYTRVETYALAKDGKSMVLTRISVTPKATETVKAFYNKVK